MKTVVLIMALIALSAGCARLDQVGKAPGLSPVGGPMDPVSARVSPARAALAAASPDPMASGRDRASLWDAGPSSLLGDRRARRRGDILTVLIEIDDQAQIANSTERARTGSESVSVPNLAGIPQLLDPILPGNASSASLADLSASGSSSGTGSVQRNERIELKIAATVVDVLPNGHLVIQGNQEVRVNFELRDLQIVGIVRPEDISRRNNITYDKVAEARISYGGRGQITDVQQPRYGQQVADILLPF